MKEFQGLYNKLTVLILHSRQRCFRELMQMALSKISMSMLVDGQNIDWRKFLCSACKFLPRDAVFTICGHIHCLECAKQLMTLSKLRCLKEDCENYLEESDCIAHLVIARYIRSQFARISVRCVNHRRKCSWIGKVQNLQEHLKSCQFGEAKCTHCGCWIVPVSERQLHEHLCQRKQAACSLTENESGLTERRGHNWLGEGESFLWLRAPPTAVEKRL